MLRTLGLLLLFIAGAADGSESSDILAPHNAVRARVGVLPLAWSDGLAKGARSWAETLLASHEFAHRPNSPYGQNLFEISGPHAHASPGQVVERWAAEAGNYDYRLNICKGTCGHYTQIVWRGTREVGCGVARNDRTEIWVCDYDPPGNIVGQRPY